MKSLILSLTFILVSTFAFASEKTNIYQKDDNLSENDSFNLVFVSNDFQNKISNKNVIIHSFNYYIGICVLNYTFHAYNSDTGQFVSQSFSYSILASSNSDCQSAGQNWIDTHFAIWSLQFD